MPATTPTSAAPTVLDVEASGFGRGSYPIEVGFVLPDGTSQCMLILPAPQWTHWDSAAESLHHVTRETLLQHGRSVADVVDVLNTALEGRTVYTDGWSYDYTWLATLYEAANRKPTFRLDNLRALLTESEVASWHPAKQEVANEMALTRHRASADARLLQMTFLRLRAITDREALQA